MYPKNHEIFEEFWKIFQYINIRKILKKEKKRKKKNNPG
jgi:hypothetical protein